MNNRSALLLLVLLLLVTACSRSGAEATPTLQPILGEGEAPVPTLDPGTGFEEPPGFGEGEITPVPNPPPETGDPLNPLPEVPPAGQRFTNLRFAASSTGFEQANFPVGTEEIYAIWDYNDMREGDTMERLWYLNDQLYVERREAWDLFKYGFVGSVRDIFLFDRIDGIDPGRWRVELYLNGELQQSAEFTVGTP